MASSARSRVATPSSPPAKEIGNAAATTVMTAVPPLDPNQINASTIQAIGGTPRMTVTIGRISRIAAKEYPATTPAAVPIPMASRKPASDRSAVSTAAAAKDGSRTMMDSAPSVSSGDGRTKEP